MAHFIDSKKLNKQDCDNLVNSSDNGLPYAYSWYLDSVCDNWGVFTDDNMNTAIPLCTKKKAGVKIVYQPKFTRQFGFYGKQNKKIISEYFSYLASNYKEIILGLDISIQVSSEFKNKEYFYQKLKLNKSYDNLKKSFSENTIRQIKKAVKNNLTISTHTSPKEFVVFFKRHTAANIKDLNNKDYTILLKLIDSAQRNDALKIFSVFKNKELIASACFIYMPHKVLYLKGSSSDEGRKTGAMYFLFDSFLQTHAQNYELLDFSGSRIKGVADFNLKWGAENEEYNFIENYNSPLYFKMLKKVKNILKK